MSATMRVRILPPAAHSRRCLPFIYVQMDAAGAVAPFPTYYIDHTYIGYQNAPLFMSCTLYDSCLGTASASSETMALGISLALFLYIYLFLHNILAQNLETMKKE
jgi:hypothetical protein